jgi:hypothetical protein
VSRPFDGDRTVLSGMYIGFEKDRRMGMTAEGRGLVLYLSFIFNFALALVVVFDYK